MTRDEMRNVGSLNNPVSWLHERAVALIYDELKRNNSPVCLRQTNGAWTSDLRQNISEVIIPGEWDQVGGIVPDLILYNSKREPVCIIEVIVTSPPSERKQQKFVTLMNRGVQVVCVQVKTKQDLYECIKPQNLKFGWNSQKAQDIFNLPARKLFKTKQRISHRFLNEFMQALRTSSPEVRREFVAFLDELRSPESLYPLSQDNPLRDKLED